jgi:hypothetical protein
MSYSASRNDIKQLAQKIEEFAKEVQTSVDTGSGFLTPAHELVRNVNTFIFALGEVHAVEQLGSGKVVRATTVSNPNYHSLRDPSTGRFRKA